jgi:gliding motility-associated-like protein
MNSGTMRKQILTILLLLPAIIHAQTNYSGYNWYFGTSLEGIRFNLSDGDPTSVSDQNPNLLRGGGAVATDHVSGELLFYTDGVRVIDASHRAMPNGISLNGNGNRNQAAATCPVPGNPDQYFVFSVNTAGNLFYHIVDMTAPGNAVGSQPPLGDVISINQIDPDVPQVTEAMLVIETGNGPYQHWLIVQEAGTNDILVFRVTAAGLDFVDRATIPFNITSAHFAYHPASGRIAVAPQNANVNIQLLSFSPGAGANTLTYDGQVLNTGFNDTAGYVIYDVEWSPNGDVLFFSRHGDGTDPGILYRYDLNVPNAAPEQVNGGSLYRSYGLQLGPDGSIYHLYQETSGGPILLGRINNPDSALATVDYESLALGSQNFNAFQFPSFGGRVEQTFDNTDFVAIGTCFGTPTKFYVEGTEPPPQRYFWDFGDPINPPPPQLQRFQAPIYEYSQPGVYEVTLIITSDGQVDTLRRTVNIVQTDTVDLGQDTVICPGETLTIDAGPGGLSYVWNNGETGQSIEVDSAGYYWVVVDYGTCTSYDGINVEVYGEPLRVANVWYFGENAGIDFNEQPPLPLNDGQIQAPAGAAAISDRNGQNLFYTNGTSVYDRSHTLMDGNIGGDSLADQSSIIIPFPEDETMFYIFTTEDIWDASGEHGYVLSYSIVDIKEIGGGTLGEVVAEDVPLFAKSTERIAAIEAGNGYWLLAHEFGTNTFRAYPITPDGIGPPVLSSIGTVHNQTVKEYGEGYMKFSPDGTKVAVALATPMGNFVELFEFDPQTGQLSNYVQIELNEDFNDYQVYGVEFSSGSEKLFVTLNNETNPQSRLYEFKIHNFNKDSIEDNIELMAEEAGVNFGALQTGPDGQIYIAMDGQGFVGQFQPNTDTLQTSNFNYVNNRFDLNGGTSGLGLPNFVQNFTNQPPSPAASVTDGCIGVPTQFTGSGTSSIDEFLWTFGDGASDTNPETEHTYLNDSIYTVTFNVSNRCGLDTSIVQQVTISGNPDEPTLDDVGVICTDSLVLDANASNTPGLTYLWNTGDTTKTIAVATPTRYSVIVANAAGCTSEDTIEVYDGRPQFDLGPTQIVCQNDSVGLNTGIPTGIPPNTFSWYINGVQTPDNTYFLVVDTGTPGDFEVAARIEDGLTGCIARDTVNITVNPIPTATTSITNSSCGNDNGSIAITSPVTGLGLQWTDDLGATIGTADRIDNLFAGTYGLLVVNNVTGCDNNYVLAVNDSNALFTISTSVTPNCDGDTISVSLMNISSFIGASYTLINNDDNTTQTGTFNSLNFDISPVTTGNYSLQISAESCTDQEDNIVVPAKTTVDLVVPPILDLCEFSASITASSATAGVQFDWSGPGGFVGAGPVVDINASGSGLYTVVASVADPNVCDTAATTDVTVNPRPEAVIEPLTDGCEGTREVGVDVTGSGNYSYLWSTGDIGPVIVISATNTYSVTVRDQATGCDTAASAQVEVYEPIDVNVSLDAVPCEDGNVVTLEADAQPPQTVTYRWSLNGAELPGETNSTLSTREEGQFGVVVSTGDCDASGQLQVVRLPVTPSDVQPSFVICPEPPKNDVALVEPGNFVNYTAILLETGAVIPESAPGVFELTEAGTYRFELENEFQCFTYDTTRVDVDCVPIIQAPTAFSPSASIPVNQTFTVLTQFVGEFRIFIYNRWGELIFFSDNLEFMQNTGWDGTRNGQLLPVGTYPYVIRFTSTTSPERGVIEQTGGITLLR